jgi:glycosyltransferase involved in cell wall biosynthesis
MFPEAKIKKNFHPTFDVFNLGDFDPNIIRLKYGIEDNIIIFFGFVREYKGLKYLIKALPEVLSKINITLLIVGEFWKDKNEYLHLINTLEIKDRVIIIDDYVPNEEIGFYFSAADIVVQPYVSATGSGIIQIAFGFNKPVIATKVGCLPEVIVDGKTGYLVLPENSRELAQAILKFFQKDNSAKFSDNVRKENYKFSWDRMVDVIEEFAP